MEITLSKWGNSLAIRIPAIMAKQLALTDGSHAELLLDGEQLVLRPSSTRKYRLRDMVTELELFGKQQETDWGEDTARETERWTWDD